MISAMRARVAAAAMSALHMNLNGASSADMREVSGEVSGMMGTPRASLGGPTTRSGTRASLAAGVGVDGVEGTEVDVGAEEDAEAFCGVAG